jgi:hypothetical protein
MKSTQAQRLLGLLSAKAPRQLAESLLEYLSLSASTSVVALFEVTEDVCRLFACTALAQEGLDWCFTSWKASEAKLVDGFSVVDGHRFLYPLKKGPSVVALLYMESPEVDLSPILDVADHLANAVVASRAGPSASAVDVYLSNTPPEEIERRKMELLCERLEWNIARVARSLRVTRPTVYRSLERLGLMDWVQAMRDRYRLGAS